MKSIKIQYKYIYLFLLFALLLGVSCQTEEENLDISKKENFGVSDILIPNSDFIGPNADQIKTIEKVFDYYFPEEHVMIDNFSSQGVELYDPVKAKRIEEESPYLEWPYEKYIDIPWVLAFDMRDVNAYPNPYFNLGNHLYYMFDVKKYNLRSNEISRIEYRAIGLDDTSDLGIPHAIKFPMYAVNTDTRKCTKILMAVDRYVWFSIHHDVNSFKFVLRFRERNLIN